MTARAWRQLRRSWRLRATPPLLWQSFIAGPLFSTLNLCQAAFTEKLRQTTSLAGSIVVLGYWRSGTTLLHNYLAHDKRFGCRSAYSCIHPAPVVLTQS